MKDERAQKIRSLIKYEFSIRGLKFVSVAKDLGLTKQYVSGVLSGREGGKAAKRVKNAICKKLGKTYEELWGE